MSLLLDPPFLIAIGFATAFLDKSRPHKTLRGPVRALSVVTIGIFWSISGLLYLNCLNFPWLGSGRHFMWNSGVELIGLKPPIDVSATYSDPFCVLNIVALLLFVTYPLFLYVGLYVGNKTVH